MDYLVCILLPLQILMHFEIVHVLHFCTLGTLWRNYLLYLKHGSYVGIHGQSSHFMISKLFALMYYLLTLGSVDDYDFLYAYYVQA